MYVCIAYPIKPIIWSCFKVLAIVDSAVMNIEILVSFQIRVFIFPRSGFSVSYGNSASSSY